MSQAFAAALAAHGLNRLAVFNLEHLPGAIGATLPLAPDTVFRQLLLLGHAGPQLWKSMSARRPPSPHPIDDFTIERVVEAFASHLPGVHFRILYPGDGPVNLLALGQAAGWHQPSPLRLGIDAQYGSWFAYRAAVIADTELLPTAEPPQPHPCNRCAMQPCRAACPAGALAGDQLDLALCAAFRLRPDSPCAYTCLARVVCPVGDEYRYPEAQIRHSYGQSLRMLQSLGMGAARGG